MPLTDRLVVSGVTRKGLECPDEHAPCALAADESIEARIRQCLLAETPSLCVLAEPLALAATYDVNVLLSGETGTGKTHLARLIHEFSPRQALGLHIVSCGAMVPSLFECELFGHARGAFTGAERAKIGRFEAAGAGTMLLDEIDTLDLEQQACLLRVVETGEYEPVGSNDKRRSQARIIVACHSDLAKRVESGAFRRDLYFRLNVIAIHLPPLRERREDIPPLTRSLVAQFADKFRKSIVEIHPDVIDALQAFPWPGNIRQLENAIQQAVLHSTGSELRAEHLPRSVSSPAPPVAKLPIAAPPTSPTLFQNREMVERDLIRSTLQDNHFNRMRSAGALGVSRVTLYKKLKKYGLLEIPVKTCMS